MGNTPDVRVRLTAEGELSIINAFRKIQAEADRTGKVGAKGLNALTNAASLLGRFLPALTFAGAIAGATALAKRTLEAGDHFAKLSQETGISVEILSTYSHGAAMAGIETDDFARGLAKFPKAINEAAHGSEMAKMPFHELGINIRNQAGALRPLDDLLGDVADSFARMPDGVHKSALAQELFWRNGEKLIPFLNKGRDGLEEFRKEAERLGLVFSTEAALAAEQFNDNLKRLRGTIDGFVKEELTALLPLLNRVAERCSRLGIMPPRHPTPWGRNSSEPSSSCAPSSPRCWRT